MHRLRLVAKHEYLKNIRRRAFVLGTLGIPLFIVVIMAISILVAIGGRDMRPLGYVDEAGVISLPASAEADDEVEMRAFSDQTAARSALEAGAIQAFYVLPSDYLTSQTMLLYYWDDSPGNNARDAFDGFLRANLVAPLPDAVRQRLLEGSHLTLRSADGRHEVSSDAGINLALPAATGMFFLFSVMTASGYLLQAVANEKENRTVELMVTSLTPGQLIGGKAIGLIAVALTQLLIWIVAAVIILIVGAQYLEALRALEVPWSFVLLIALYFFPSYALVAGIMIAIGGIVTDTRQGQQIAGLINLLFTAPFFFVVIALTNPEHPILVALTLFPTSALMTVAVRWGLTVIPTWQLIVSWVVLVVAAGVSIWAAARIFRAGMLRYGQRLDLRSVIRSVRASIE